MRHKRLATSSTLLKIKHKNPNAPPATHGNLWSAALSQCTKRNSQSLWTNPNRLTSRARTAHKQKQPYRPTSAPLHNRNPTNQLATIPISLTWWTIWTCCPRNPTSTQSSTSTFAPRMYLFPQMNRGAQLQSKRNPNIISYQPKKHWSQTPELLTHATQSTLIKIKFLEL